MVKAFACAFCVPVLVQACVSDHDCSLLGSCVDSICQCDPGWKGSKCGQVDLLPARRDAGYHNPSMSSWCGSAIKVDDKYHYFGSGISGGCSLPQFATNSFSAWATSSSPRGPYEFEQVALPEFAHSTSITRDVDGGYLLWSIGKNMNGTDVRTCEGEGPWPKSAGPKDDTGTGPHDYVRLAKSKNIEGPWEERVILQTDLSDPTAWNCNKSNPSAVTLSNGSILLMYRGQRCTRDPTCKNSTINLCQAQGIAFAENSDAPFVDRQGSIDALRGNEDAFFWQSERGFHALFHSKNACGQSQEEVDICGGLAFSPDSWHWTLNPEPVYDGAIVWEEPDGTLTEAQLQTRERPNILFDEDGKTPLMLINGVSDFDEQKSVYSLFVPFNVPANTHKENVLAV